MSPTRLPASSFLFCLGAVLSLLPGCPTRGPEPVPTGLDAGLPRSMDGGLPVPDAGEPDAGEPDAGEPDAGPRACLVPCHGFACVDGVCQVPQGADLAHGSRRDLVLDATYVYWLEGNGIYRAPRAGGAAVLVHLDPLPLKDLNVPSGTPLFIDSEGSLQQLFPSLDTLWLVRRFVNDDGVNGAELLYATDDMVLRGPLTPGQDRELASLSGTRSLAPMADRIFVAAESALSTQLLNVYAVPLDGGVPRVIINNFSPQSGPLRTSATDLFWVGPVGGKAVLYEYNPSSGALTQPVTQPSLQGLSTQGTYAYVAASDRILRVDPAGGTQTLVMTQASSTAVDDGGVYWTYVSGDIPIGSLSPGQPITPPSFAPGACLPLGARSCFVDSDCCSGACSVQGPALGGTCVSASATQGRACLTKGLNCSDSAFCCSGLCFNNSCTGEVKPGACRHPGLGCRDSADCCSHNCVVQDGGNNYCGYF